MHTCKRKAREKEQRRKEIIRVAGDLFFSRGYDDVTMEEVARETELAIGTLYLYFRNKDALFCAVALEGVSALNGMFRHALLENGSGAEKLEALGESYLEFYRRSPGQFKAFVEMQSRQFPAEDESVIKINAIVSENIHEIMCGCILEGMGDGSLRRDLDPLQTALLLIISMQSVICLMPAQQAAFGRAGISPEGFARYSLNLMVKSLSSDRSGSTGVGV